jgi:hypothetical protein
VDKFDQTQTHLKRLVVLHSSRDVQQVVAVIMQLLAAILSMPCHPDSDNITKGELRQRSQTPMLILHG